MSEDLRTYVEQLRRRRGELIDVRRQVSPVGEISAVVKSLEPMGKPAVMFHDVEGTEIPVIMGLFGTRDRLANSLGVDRRSLVTHVLSLMGSELPEVIPVTDPEIDGYVREGNEVDLGSLPIGVHSRDDAGAYITSGVVAARDPRTGAINTGMYRIMVTGSNTLTVNAAPDHDLGRIFLAAAREGRNVDIAIVIGHHPAYAIASQLKNPVEVDAHELTGALLGQRFPVTAGLTVDLDIPADAEIVLEGVVRPADRVDEGPFGEFTYYYGAAQAPECTVTAMRIRTDPIFHDLHPTHDEHRCLWLFPGREARLFQAVRAVVPGVQQARIPFHSGSLSAFLSITKARQGDGKQAALAALASDHFLKHVVVVDDDVDVFDDAAVLWASNVRVQADIDMFTIPQAKGIRMDPSATVVSGGDRITAKTGLDATRPLYPQFPERADLPFRGYENLNPADYLSSDDMKHINSISRVLRQIEE